MHKCMQIMSIYIIMIIIYIYVLPLLVLEMMLTPCAVCD